MRFIRRTNRSALSRDRKTGGGYRRREQNNDSFRSASQRIKIGAN